ncbi:MAG: pyridoxamine 5'-phosphate oxidase family protein [Dermatophilaceae bacterium]
MSGDAVPPTDHSGLRVVETGECYRLLRSVPLGRFAFDLHGELCVLPVVHVVDGITICFRTAGASKLTAAVNQDRVAFEADSYHAERWSGWSVLVQGTAEVVSEPLAVRRLEEIAPPWWLPGSADETTWIRVRPLSVTGRTLG